MIGPQLTREQWLAIMLGIVAVVYWGGDSLVQSVFAPLSTRQQTLSTLRKKTLQQEQDLALIDRTHRQMQLAQQQALPPNPSTATALYQEWLIQSASQSGLNAAVVTPHATVREPEIGHTVSMTLQAQAGLPEISNFLQQFHSAPLLHRIESCSISQVDPLRPSESLKLTLQVTGLSLEGGEPRSTLIHPQSRVPEPAEQSAESMLATSRIFERATTHSLKQPPPDLVTAPPPVRNPLETIRLVGTWRTGGRSEAWFHDEARRQELILRSGAPFSVATLQGTVISLEQDSVTLQVLGRNHTLTLGDPLSKISQ